MPHLVQEENVSKAWLAAKNHILGQPGHRCNSLIVAMQNPLELDDGIHDQYNEYCQLVNITKPNKASSTIFPKKSYEILGHDRFKLYQRYPRVHKVLKGKWGSYFGQMIDWKDGQTRRNQLEDIINMINDREKVHKSAYTIQVVNPVKHLGWPRGAPCLNHILLQLENEPRKMSLLAVYRNHDFGVKAYGNYIGLGHLLEFLASQTNFDIGSITCVSSHAFVTSRHVAGLRDIG